MMSSFAAIMLPYKRAPSGAIEMLVKHGANSIDTASMVFPGAISVTPGEATPIAGHLQSIKDSVHKTTGVRLRTLHHLGTISADAQRLQRRKHPIETIAVFGSPVTPEQAEEANPDQTSWKTLDSMDFLEMPKDYGGWVPSAVTVINMVLSGTKRATFTTSMARGGTDTEIHF